MRNEQFEIRRADGRSDAQVILDMVDGKEPGTKFSHRELIDALSEGCDRTFSRSDVCSAVQRAERRLLSEQSRSLINIRGFGYKIAHAAEHRLVAKNRKAKADMQLRKGLFTLQNVRWDEMDDNQRMAHEGTLMVIGSLVAAQDAIRERQDRIEERLQKAIGRAPDS